MPTDPLPQGFSTPQVRDLAWVIQSPALLDSDVQDLQWPTPLTTSVVIGDHWCEQRFHQQLHWLSALDNDPQPLLEWLKTRHNPRLGYYFESLVEFWLRHEYSSLRFVPHLQVKDQHRTLGEFDYLFEDRGKHVIHHWEVAVKFYLHYQDSPDHITWYGPNPRDRLDIKLQRLFHHQLRLSLYPAAAATLRQAGLTLPVVPRLLMKGYLFYPANGDWRHPLVAAGLSAGHLRGWWTYLDQFEIPNAHADRGWLFLPRLRWLSSAAVRHYEPTLMNFEQLHEFCLDLLNRKQRPPLIAEMQKTPAGDWREVSRGFVVPQNWPQHRAI